MANIDLSKFVDKTVLVTLRDNSQKTCKLAEAPCSTSSYPYVIKNDAGEFVDSYTRDGRIWKNLSFSTTRDIIGISQIPSFAKDAKSQARPHINLEDFLGKEVYVIMNKKVQEATGFSNRMIAKVERTSDKPDEYCIQGNYFNRDGTRAYESSKYIIEIHSTGSFEVVTNGIQDPPPKVDPKVQKAQEALKELTSEQIAKLWESIQKPQDPDS